MANVPTLGCSQVEAGNVEAAVMKKAMTLIKQIEGEADCISVLVQSTSTFLCRIEPGKVPN